MTDLMNCPKCDQPHKRCHAHVKSTGKPCQAQPPAGATVCKSHGLNGAAKAKAARKTAAANAEVVLRRFGEPVDTSPTEALLDAVRWTAGYVAWLREKVAAVKSDEALVWGQTREKFGGDDQGTTYEAKPNVWLVLLSEWHDKLVRVCAETIKAGVEERRVRLAEQQGALVAEVIKAILADLHLTADQQGLVAEVVPRHLRLLAS
jgi:hypothetical protein